MGRSLLAALLLIVLFLGLALIIVMFGIVPELTNLAQGPTPRPVVLTAQPRTSLSPAAAEPQIARPTRVTTAAPIAETPAPATPAPTPDPTLVAKANALVEKMFQNEAAGIRYRFTTLGTYTLEPARGATNQVSIRVEGEVDGINVRQLLSTGEQVPDEQLSQIEMRLVDGVTYLYANQKWQVAPGDPSGTQQRFFREPVDLKDSSVRLELLGVEQLANVSVPTYRYRINVPSGQVALPAAPANLPQGTVPTVEAQQSGYLWVGADGRRYRVEYSIRLRVPQGSMMVGWDLVTRCYGYDDPTIHVEAPGGVVPGGE